MAWVYFDRTWMQQVQDRLDGTKPWGQATLQQLAWQQMQIDLQKQSGTGGGFPGRRLSVLNHARDWQPFPHQIETAERVIFEMRCRAILADEVGMGKTIEAGLVLAELLARGHVQRALILVPASLVMQWTRELNQKFQIQAQAFRKSYMWQSAPILVSTLETVKREPHRSLVLAQAYDLLIVDEAHKLKNPRSANYLFLSEIRKRACLLLTATPLQNDLKEMYHLVGLVRPGQLSNEETFRDDFVAGKHSVKNAEQLRLRLDDVMVRNSRTEAGIDLPPRDLHLHSIRLSELERNLYDAVSAFVLERAAHCQMKNEQFTLMTLQREVCSSRDALFLTLVKWFGQLSADSPLRARIWQLVQAIKEVKTSAKSKHALDLIQASADKVVIFTAYRATQEHLIDQLAKRNIPAVAFYGKMKRGKRDWMLDLFKGRAQVLVATDAGSEGLNIQWCNQVIHYDLPWNPMRLEQRNGRVHRIGQTRGVHIHYLLIEDSIESYIWEVLTQKSAMIAAVMANGEQILPDLEVQPWRKLSKSRNDPILNWASFRKWIERTNGS